MLKVVTYFRTTMFRMDENLIDVLCSLFNTLRCHLKLNLQFHFYMLSLSLSLSLSVCMYLIVFSFVIVRSTVSFVNIAVMF